MNIKVITLLPDAFPGILSMSLAGQALKKNLWSLATINLKDFGRTKHKNVDDEPCGGGNGLVIRPDVLGDAIDFALKDFPDAKILYPSPRGQMLKQGMVKQLTQEKNIIIICGRFEGIDERIIAEYNVQQISVGDYILSGGEIAAFCIIDSIVRLVPGVLKNQNTLKDESFEICVDGKLLVEHPLYTKPSVWRGLKVPEVLLSGNHEAVAKWRLTESIRLTKEREKE